MKNTFKFIFLYFTFLNDYTAKLANKKVKNQSGRIKTNNQKIKVFKVEASYKDIFNGMDVKNEGVDLDKFMTLGSMTEPTTNGNWSK